MFSVFLLFLFPLIRVYGEKKFGKRDKYFGHLRPNPNKLFKGGGGAGWYFFGLIFSPLVVFPHGLSGFHSFFFFGRFFLGLFFQ